MRLTKFCCCCDLRRGCIVFAWLQMMGITMTIATLIAYSDMMTTIAEASAQGNLNSDNFHDLSTFYALINSVASMKMMVGSLFIKGVTCISLTWGVVKQCHLYYQPWLFIAGFEASVFLIVVFVFFILGCVLSSIFFLIFFLYGGIAALNWYFWACVYTVYQKDMKPSSISFELQYNNYDEPALI